MIIDTKEISSRIKLGSMLVVLVLVAVVVLDLIFRWVPNFILVYVCIALFVLFEAYLLMKKYNYIYYNSDGFKIILKYTSLGMFSAGNYKLEIPKKDFVRIEIEKSIMGMRKMVVIYVRTPNGIAKFKPISISVLSEAELNDMMSDLESIKR
ncbi:MAG: hypothetical protein J6S84_04755 [Bacteroidales bacterium]|nr:hypothetical protein [Bacteroidales bacterium]